MSDPSQQSPHPSQLQILTRDVQQKIEAARNQSKKIVFVSGIFDLLHEEHVRFLEKAKAVGDFLIVALESDARVRIIKGEGRPVQSQEVRQQSIEKLGVADVIFILPDDFADASKHRRLIEEVRPAILAVSSHSPYLDKKKAIVEEFGGKLMIVHQHNPAISTTQLLAQKGKK